MGGSKSYLNQIRERFSLDLYATEATSISIEEAGEHYAKCSLTIERKHRNAMGVVMGGVIFTLCDFAFAIASNSVNDIAITMSTNISYLSQPKGHQLIAKTSLVRDGKTTCCYEVKVTDELDTAVALAVFNGYKINHRD